VVLNKEMLYHLYFSKGALQYAIRKIQENQVRVNLCGTHQLLVYAHDVIGDNMIPQRKTQKLLTDTRNEIGLKVNTEETNKGMVRSDISKPALIFFSLQECTQQNPLSKF
jgi:hypothetical protein